MCGSMEVKESVCYLDVIVNEHQEITACLFDAHISGTGGAQVVLRPNVPDVLQQPCALQLGCVAFGGAVIHQDNFGPITLRLLHEMGQ